MERYLTSEQVAQVLQVHPFTVLKYLKTGTLEGVKIGRVYRIKESEVERFLGGMSIKKNITQNAQQDPSQSQQNQPKTHEIKFPDNEKDKPDHYYKII